MTSTQLPLAESSRSLYLHDFQRHRIELAASSLFAPQIARLFPQTGWLTPQDVNFQVKAV
ncbi:MAG: hypothetical protein U0401_00925 [Anaerolineae bacterium]